MFDKFIFLNLFTILIFSFISQVYIYIYINRTLKRVDFSLYMHALWTYCTYTLWTKTQFTVDLHSSFATYSTLLSRKYFSM
jgi:hypothetical protein